ncbi:N-acylglucosamine 2-epimerase [Haloprofundus marisrubri]|uniref:N-acylglucosamine 2-epimerase n=1 Tax=Haloprofundus marisrubri TaxID=1514971 RepID=A0A0W1R5H1_9EURY|nr:AGE family epimerase/isomerase [Haloprofundus marisrubri]KTG08335.1 N-acylglucosamine 2-epimerase [Haloprofundus marisrubri]
MTDRFRDPAWLRGHVADVLTFYYPTCVDETRGGFVAQLDERTSRVYDPEPRHLVASARFVVNFARGARLDDAAATAGTNTPDADALDWCRSAAARGAEFLADAHRDAEAGGYQWLLSGTDPVDERRSCYGHAFVLLAYAEATMAGVPGARERLEATADLVDERFWEADHGLCRSELDADWNSVESYRGQNANMHMCEAMLGAYEATENRAYLDRALTIARRMTVDLTETTDGRIWEHYTESWDHDFAYNREQPEDLFRPWGYQPGHHAEWAKLTAALSRHTDEPWPRERATELFDAALDGWDEEYGGFYYTLDREGDPVVDDKYGWPVAEAIGAAAVLSDVVDDADRERYLEWYDRLWAYAEANLVAPGGNWYTQLTRENEYVDTSDGPAVEPGYHPIGACWEALRSFDG